MEILEIQCLKLPTPLNIASDNWSDRTHLRQRDRFNWNDSEWQNISIFESIYCKGYRYFVIDLDYVLYYWVSSLSFVTLGSTNLGVEIVELKKRKGISEYINALPVNQWLLNSYAQTHTHTRTREKNIIVKGHFFFCDVNLEWIMRA